MGFWKRNWEKISADTISGLFIRITAAFLLLILGLLVAPKFVTLPADNAIIIELIVLARRVIMYVYFILIFFLPTILGWLSERRQDRNKEWELKNENKKLENENLKLQLELRQQEQQYPPEEEK